MPAKHTATEDSDAERPWVTARARGAGLVVRGLCMGAADVIPGVSGGTIALITGIYDELVATIAGVNVRLVRCLAAGRFAEGMALLNAGFLLPLLAGIALAILGLAGPITFLMEAHPTPFLGFLTGLIGASAMVVGRRIDGWGSAARLALLAGIASGYFVTILVPLQTGGEWYKLLLSGAVASCAMILPGISGSFLLLLLGKYHQVLSAVHERDLVVIVVFGGGFALGILVFSRLLKRLLARHHDPMMALLVGLMAGSLRKVWPFRMYTEEGAVAQSTPAVVQYECVLPGEFTATVVLTAVFIVVGIGLVMGVERLSRVGAATASLPASGSHP